MSRYLLVKISLAVTFTALALRAAASDAPATQPSAAAGHPATQPAGYAVRGRIQIAAGWNLLPPDLSRVVVYIGSEPALDSLPAPVDHPSVAQHNKAFEPNFTVVSSGTTVEFPNWDHFDHNVFSRSKAAPAFDLDRYGYGQSKSRVFDKTGVVQVFCNVHPQMRAIIYVTPNPCFTRADSEGRFELTGIPAGRHELIAWQERCGEQRQTIDVGPDGPGEITFTLDENRRSIIENDPPQRDRAYGVERGLGVKREKLDLPVVEDVHPAPTTAPVD
jgi:plastocyanin